MLIRSKAPLRLGLAGGGTDVAPYSDIFGGAILNATISMYAYATIKPTTDGKIVFRAIDKKEECIYKSSSKLKINGKLDLHTGAYNRIVKEFSHKPLSFELSTYVDAPAGSGLGTSSTLMVAILGAFAEWLKLPMGEYDIAHLAYEIERIDLGMAGGKQDQYSATFGGVNYMEFFKNDKVIVNPLRIKEKYLSELSNNLILYYTDTSRLSSAIIESQQKNVRNRNKKSVDAMHKLKEQAVMMKECLLKGNVDEVGKILDFGWKYKKQLANGVSNKLIDDLYSIAMKNGATGGKISGAGGGGFIFFYCPGNSRFKVVDALIKYGGQVKRYDFTLSGLSTWTI
jgi:D-glycero-alpha-D-manno-heptose-7-phosphate kinase